MSQEKEETSLKIYQSLTDLHYGMQRCAASKNLETLVDRYHRRSSTQRSFYTLFLQTD